MRIAVDAMGTDANPVSDVEGAVLAARERNYQVILVGDETVIRGQLARHDTQGLPLEVLHAPQTILMTDKPSVVGRGKPDSSMHIGMKLVRDGKADAFVTAGNTGAAHAIAMLHTLHRIPGVKRPALSGIFVLNRKPVIFLDIGANADAKPEWLAQFAIMGEVYAANALGLKEPRVGILSNGEEEGKGNQLIHEALALIRQLPLNCVGNVEPKEVLDGKADVIVSDGFTGNILLKTFEASTRYLGRVIRDELKFSVFNKIGGLLAKSAFERARRKIDTSEVGGAPLLGVNGIVIISHGSADATAIKNAVIQAARAVEGGIVDAIKSGLATDPTGQMTKKLSTEG